MSGPSNLKRHDMQIDFNSIIDGQNKLKSLGDMLKKSIDEIQLKYEKNMVEIIKVMDDNQKRHATAISEVHKTIESIMNR